MSGVPLGYVLNSSLVRNISSIKAKFLILNAFDLKFIYKVMNLRNNEIHNLGTSIWEFQIFVNVAFIGIYRVYFKEKNGEISLTLVPNVSCESELSKCHLCTNLVPICIMTRS